MKFLKRTTYTYYCGSPFPSVTVHFRNHSTVYSVASNFGQPLKLDIAIANLSRPSVVRMLLKMVVFVQYKNEMYLVIENDPNLSKNIAFEAKPNEPQIQLIEQSNGKKMQNQ
ncbi:hypothetical protein IEQ34_015515 [Dendrobium chrysotoxum]|uniref:Uncharacterized protein n=1 Tax=Dendrobium chrysotoxum TaxID=161865 RepID=A0AAV7GIL4_DENCH|nr:hypothetical protein IEQ34_015515 [Dendrobium chrysotoxum]